MTQVALYARVASSRQNENDDRIKEQFRACREYATQAGWEVVSTYDDLARSSLDFQRPGLQTLLEDARRGRFGIVLVEDECRLSRDQADIADLLERMHFAGVRIITLAEGEIP